jgi:hypothetical protein
MFQNTTTMPHTPATALPTSTAAPRLLHGAVGACALAALACTLSIGPGAHATAAQSERQVADAAEVERVYLIGPKQAFELGCSVAWQTAIPMPAGQSLRFVGIDNDAILALNSRNEVSLIRPGNGDRGWTASGAESIDKILSVDLVRVTTPEGVSPRVIVTTDTGVYGLDFKDGASVLRKPFKLVPSTAPVASGDTLVFGTRSGQISWFNCSSGFERRAYTVDGPFGKSPILAKPVIADGNIVAASAEGTVIALDESSGNAYWRKKLLAGVQATPAVANGVVFVASEDQYLYAFDLGSGETLWKYFTQSPLTTAPFAAGDLVLQDIPNEGVVAFTQSPEGQLGGEVRWKKTGIAGAPITTAEISGRSAVAFWCPKGRTVTFVDALKGDVLSTVALPQVEHLDADRLDKGGFVAWSSDGRIERLAPAAAADATTAKAAADSNG